MSHETLLSLQHVQGKHTRLISQEDIQKAIDQAFGGFSDLYACNSLEKMAEYADHICIQMTKDPVFQKGQLTGMKDIDLSASFDQMNPTSLGNLAYSCLHAPEPYNDQWRDVLRELKEKNNLPIKFEI